MYTEGRKVAFSDDSWPVKRCMSLGRWPKRLGSVSEVLRDSYRYRLVPSGRREPLVSPSVLKKTHPRTPLTIREVEDLEVSPRLSGTVPWVPVHLRRSTFRPGPKDVENSNWRTSCSRTRNERRQNQDSSVSGQRLSVALGRQKLLYKPKSWTQVSKESQVIDKL